MFGTLFSPMAARHAVVCACLVAAGTAAGATIRVPLDAANIQAAIDQANSPGDIVEVDNGTWKGPGNRNLDFDGRLITVRSRSGAPHLCVIDCEGSGRGFIFQSGENAAAVVAGFTILNGAAPANTGGGGMIIIPGGVPSSPTITNCIFRGCIAQVGGAISMTSCSSLVINCQFLENNGNVAAGVQIIGGFPELTNCVFFDNVALGSGGGLSVVTGSLPLIVNCTFGSNGSAVGFGGGMFTTANSLAQIRNCIFWGNIDSSGSVVSGQIGGTVESTPSVLYSTVQGSWPGTGNKSADPLFVNAVLGDLRLSSGSPAIDAGENASVTDDASDLDGDGDLIEAVPIDLDRHHRFYDDPVTADTGVAGNGHPDDIVDMGGYEFGALSPPRRSDLLWRHNDGRALVWLMDGTQQVGQGSPGSASQGWRIAGAGDFDGDDRSDILWRNTGTGEVFIWFVHGTQRVGFGSAGFANPALWEIVGTGNFDGDPQGRADILWRNTANGQVFVWLMDGAQPIEQASPGIVAQVWAIVGVGDFDGDDRADILWRNTSNGQVVIWLMNGTQRVGAGSPGIAAAEWTIVGTGNFDADPQGRSDILWRRANGQVFIWLMNGTQRIGQGSPGTAGNIWSVTGTGDFDGDGHTDILWRNQAASGQVFTWFIEGTARVGQGPVGTVPHAWQILGVEDFNRQ